MTDMNETLKNKVDDYIIKFYNKRGFYSCISEQQYNKAVLLIENNFDNVDDIYDYEDFIFHCQNLIRDCISIYYKNNNKYYINKINKMLLLQYERFNNFKGDNCLKYINNDISINNFIIKEIKTHYINYFNEDVIILCHYNFFIKIECFIKMLKDDLKNYKLHYNLFDNKFICIRNS